MGLITFLKRIAKQSIILKSILFKLFAISSKLKIRKAKKVFEQAPEMPIWLERDTLDELQQKYKFPTTASYDAKNLEVRGKERAKIILRLIRSTSKNREKLTTFLELGCKDGMVSYFLNRAGKITTAIDIRSEEFDERAKSAGITLLQMDAAHLQFKDENFDFIFSYNTFEHFSHPRSVLEEAIRVVKIGGYIYLRFEPLYMSPMGLHAYRSITVPYCQFLFPKELLQDFVKVNGLKTIPFDSLNGWSLEDFHSLWEMNAHRLKKVIYYEKYATSYLDLIMKYPSCFRSKTKYFENLIVSSIEVLFKRIK